MPSHLLDEVASRVYEEGGVEAVFTRRIDYLQIDQQRLPQFEIEIGGMDYGFEINGILGMDVLLAAEAIINLHDLRLEFNKPN